MKRVRSLFWALLFLAILPDYALSDCIEGNCNHGRGTYIYSDGSSYKGQWENGMFSGHGIFKYSNGTVYVGEWKNNLRNGQGTLTRPNGSKYMGHWVNDRFDGQGTYVYPDESKYVGQWKHNRRNGKGLYISANGSQYKGQWLNGKLVGKGIFTTSDGITYLGQFDKDGKLVDKYSLLNDSQNTSKDFGVLKGSEDEALADSGSFQNDNIKKSEGDKTTFTNSLGMKFNYVKPGSFIMGSPEKEKGRYVNETPHKMTIKKGFYMQATEVTQAQWFTVMEINPSFFDKCGSDCPVEQVSWEDVQEFINRLNQLEVNDKYGLPSEAQWEYSCRTGSLGAFSNGQITVLDCEYDKKLDDLGWYCGNSSEKTHPAASKTANAWGLYDMHGNVSELCQDWYGIYSPDQITDTKGPSSGIDRIVRGGGWDAHARHCRSACRGAISPVERSSSVGFRLIKIP